MTDLPVGVIGVLLAGGRSTRMGGGDKCLLTIGGQTILARIVDRTKSQVKSLVINANGDVLRFSNFCLPVVPDVIPGFVGPLAGVLSGMEWALNNDPDCRWIASIPTDVPFIPNDLIFRLAKAVVDQDAELACAVSAGRIHPVVGLWSIELRDKLRQALVIEETRKIVDFTANYRLAKVVFEVGSVDPFFNTNRPEDLAVAEQLLKDGDTYHVL